MRILLLAPELFTTDSGIPRMLRLYLKALCDLAGERGGRVDFVALNDALVDTTELRPYSGPAFASWSVCSRDKVRFIRETLRLGRNADLIVCGHVAQLPVAWLVRRFHRRVRYVLVAHGIEVWRPFTFWQRRAIARAERVWCVSEFTRDEVRRRIKLPDEKLAVLPNALDPQLAPAADAAPLPPDPVILTIARLTRADSYKGIDHLIAALPAIRAAEPRARLRIVGRGDDRDRLYQLARKLQVLEAVEFAGFVPNEQLPGEFQRCRLFALPSEREGFGLVYVEAMAHGRPCLGARAGGTTEVITPETGVLVPYGDVPALAAAVLEALRRDWAPAPILARAGHFSYSQFRTRLASLLPW